MSTDTFKRLMLIIAGCNLFPVAVTLKSGQIYPKGAVLASITAGGASDEDRLFTLVDSSKNDGTEKPKYILSEEVDATSADVPGIAYRQGKFNEAALTFGGADTADTHRDALELRGVFLGKISYAPDSPASFA